MHYTGKMPRVITYDLRNNNTNSGAYYFKIAEFTNNWLGRIPPVVGDLIDRFRHERQVEGLPARSVACCAFEILVLGVYMLDHEEKLIGVSGLWRVILLLLLKIQSGIPSSEGFIKLFRGLVYQISSALGSKTGKFATRAKQLDIWLRSTGEATIADRVNEWFVFFVSQNIEEKVAEGIINYSKEFIHSSQRILGEYTQEVDIFRKTYATRHRFRYDAPMLDKSRPMYHLGMLGTELLNREYRERFLKCPNKIVILPPCMRAKPDGECNAALTSYGARCASCTPSCRIHQITKLGEKKGFDVFIIPDELRDLSGGREKGLIGVVGVSCVLTNWTGGLDAEKLGIPAQGVLLDYVGCRHHWDDEGFPTEINIQQLLMCLNVGT